ncbi:phage minor capsid protein [Alkalibacillus sp. S2W]|uniref:phage minor capsid protein n=1 Tax=Alkalibacillus sp. S2W TaxID=3386553 RepID=UPI00398D43FC
MDYLEMFSQFFNQKIESIEELMELAKEDMETLTQEQLDLILDYIELYGYDEQALQNEFETMEEEVQKVADESYNEIENDVELAILVGFAFGYLYTNQNASDNNITLRPNTEPNQMDEIIDYIDNIDGFATKENLDYIKGKINRNDLDVAEEFIDEAKQFIVSAKSSTGERTAEVMKDELEDKVSQWIAQGKTRQEITDRLMQSVNDEGIRYVVPNGNRKYQPQNYIKMVYQGQIQKAHRKATEEEAERSGQYYAEIPSRNAVCDICKDVQGHIVFIGRNADDNFLEALSIDYLRDRGFQHLNCNHPERLVSNEQAENGNILTSI